MCEPKKFYAVVREHHQTFQGEERYECLESALRAAERVASGWNERVFVLEAIQAVSPAKNPVTRTKL